MRKVGPRTCTSLSVTTRTHPVGSGSFSLRPTPEGSCGRWSAREPGAGPRKSTLRVPARIEAPSLAVANARGYVARRSAHENLLHSNQRSAKQVRLGTQKPFRVAGTAGSFRHMRAFCVLGGECMSSLIYKIEISRTKRLCKFWNKFYPIDSILGTRFQQDWCMIEQCSKRICDETKKNFTWKAISRRQRDASSSLSGPFYLVQTPCRKKNFCHSFRISLERSHCPVSPVK